MHPQAKRALALVLAAVAPFAMRDAVTIDSADRD